MTSTVLVLTQPGDAHADCVVDALSKRGARPVRFHTRDFPSKWRLETKYRDGRLVGRFANADNLVEVDEIVSVW